MIFAYSWINFDNVNFDKRSIRHFYQSPKVLYYPERPVIILNLTLSLSLSPPQICHQKKECFDMNSRRDPPKIGTDEFGQDRLTYYECHGGYCSEIYNLKCERRCNSKTFYTRGQIQ